MSCRPRIVKFKKPSSRSATEENIRRKEKELEEKRQWFLSHFSKNRKGDISKDKEVVILSDEDEQAKSSAIVSATTPPTLEQITQLVVNGQEKILANVQNMIDKSLGKQPLIDDSSTPRPKSAINIRSRSTTIINQRLLA